VAGKKEEMCKLNGNLWMIIFFHSFLQDEVTVNKIKIFKSGKDYTSTMLEYMDAESLPVSLGGKCQCIGGCECSDAGPWTPSPQ
jgi:hypothetical protein